MKHVLFVLVLAAGAPTATPKAKSPPKPAAKSTPAKAKAKTAATPASKPEEPIVSSGERTLTKGEATFKLGKSAKKLADVKGSIQASGGYHIASVAFTGKKERLQLDFMFVGTGPVDQITSLYVIDEDGASSAYRKGVTSCTVTLEQATPMSISGTASCPKGMLDLESKPGKPLTEVKFTASAE